MKRQIEIRDPDPGSWPLPLPEELVVRALLPALDRDARSALRLTSRSLRLAVDASVSTCCLWDDNYTHKNLPRFVATLPRLRGLRELSVKYFSDDRGLAVFAATAVPKLHQLTSLMIGPGRRADDLPMTRGSAVLAQQLSCLQRLQSFCLYPWGSKIWAMAAEEMANALARLPALRILDLEHSFSGEVLRRPCDELGDGAWRSLEGLSVPRVQGAADVQALASAPFPRLTRLRFATPGHVTNLCPAISGAPWGPQLRHLTLTLVDSLPPGILTGLALPNLERLELNFSGHFTFKPVETLTLEGWSLPKLQSLKADADVVSCSCAVSLAALHLPALTQLQLAHGARPFTAPVLNALLRGAAWLPQLQVLEVAGPALGPYDPGSTECKAAVWANLAAAPLTALRSLSLPHCQGMDAAGGAALGCAPWLSGLKHLSLRDLRGEALTALRAGNGGFSALEAAGRLKVWSMAYRRWGSITKVPFYVAHM